MMRALAACVQLVLWGRASTVVVLIAVTGLCIHYLCLPHQALHKSSTKYECLVHWGRSLSRQFPSLAEAIACLAWAK